jgi:HSP20 family protein
MDRLFADAFVRPSRPWSAFGGEFSPAMDVYETPDAVVVKMLLPGFKPEEVQVNLKGDTLTISSERKEETAPEGADYYIREVRHGTFSRTVRLGVPVDGDKAEATYEHGVLTLTLPKKEEVRGKVISVKVAGTKK